MEGQTFLHNHCSGSIDEACNKLVLSHQKAFSLLVADNFEE